MPVMLWPVLGLLAVGFVLSLPLTALLVRVGRRMGMTDTPGASGHQKKTIRAVPNIGGIAVFIAIALPMGLGLAALHVIDEATWARWLPAVVDHLPRIRSSTPTAVALLACIAVLHVVGLIDDRRSLPPLPKLIAQIAAAAVLVVWFDVRLLELLGPIPSIVVTVLWIVLITNAINFMDNMDGLAAGVTVIAGGLFMVATLVNSQWFIAATLALLVGAALGFLVFNFPPAKIFLGDGGSLVIGFLLAVLVARTTFYNPDSADAALGTAWYGVLMPVVVLAVPLYDIVTVTAIRLRQGRSPFVGDQQHFSHRLVQRGLSRRGAVVIIWGVTAITGISGIALGRLLPWQAMLVGAQTIVVLVVLALLEHASRRVADQERAS
jgi:UDP-GlcNAc:undecaprenyl-phosphate GlcNAc-1-phosphate transferase